MDQLQKITLGCQLHHDAQTITGLVKEGLLVVDYMAAALRGQNTHLVEGIVTLFVLYAGQPDLYGAWGTFLRA
jgi:hypothetical protein